MTFVREQPDGVVSLSLYIQPKAARNEVIGLHDGALKLAITAPPIDGKANAAVAAFLAETLGVAKRDVTLVRGESSRRKQFAVRGLSAETIRQKLAPAP